MLARHLLLSAVVLLDGYVTASAFNPPHPCKAFPTKVSKLWTCSTASAFCRNYLGGDATFTRTITKVVTRRAGTVTETSTPVETDVSTSVITEAADTSTATVFSGTTTTYASVCNVVDKRAAAAAKKPNSYCGIAQTQSSSLISGACNCYLRSRTLYLTTTRTGISATSTVLASDTTTTETTTTTTTTTTPVTTVTLPATTECAVGCGPPGLQFAVYHNDQGDFNAPSYSNFNAQHFASLTPDFESTTTELGGINTGLLGNGGDITVYGTDYEFPGDYFVLNHRGYLNAPQTGTYVLTTTSYTDELMIAWIGPHAYSGYTSSNSQLYAPFPNGQVYIFNANQGDVVPIRVFLVNAGAGASLNMELIAPDGTVLLDSNSGSSQSIVQYCGEAGPPFPPFGSE